MTVTASWNDVFDLSTGQGARLLAKGAGSFGINWDGQGFQHYELNTDSDLDGTPDALTAGFIWPDDGQYLVRVRADDGTQSHVDLRAEIHLEDGLTNISGAPAQSTFILTGSQSALVTLGSKDDLVQLQGGGTAYGYGGNDKIYLTNHSANQIYGGNGNDTVLSSSDNVSPEMLSGGAGDDVLFGGGGADRIIGGSGVDVLKGGGGRDTVNGGAGDDRISGDGGGDRLTGGSDQDRFIFFSGDAGTGTNRDTIADFTKGEDVIQFENNGLSNFIETNGFSHSAGEFRYQIVNGNTQILGDTDGDGKADVLILVLGEIALASDNFTSHIRRGRLTFFKGHNGFIYHLETQLPPPS